MYASLCSSIFTTSLSGHQLALEYALPKGGKGAAVDLMAVYHPAWPTPASRPLRRLAQVQAEADEGQERSILVALDVCESHHGSESSSWSSSADIYGAFSLLWVGASPLFYFLSVHAVSWSLESTSSSPPSVRGSEIEIER